MNLSKAKELSPKAYSGFGAGARRSVARNIPGVSESEGVTATTELETLVGQNALDQLKAIFGGAPTEGERKILLDLQGSLSMSDAERQKLFDRAIAAAARRVRQNEDKMKRIRQGAYSRVTPESNAAGGPVGHYAYGGAVHMADGGDLFDRLGAQFTLVDFSGGVASAGANELLNAAKARGLPLHYLQLNDSHARGLWERDLVLVRPDQHVAWRGNAAPADALALMDQVRGMG